MALEWLKTILGTAYTEEIDKSVSTQIGKEFVSRADFNALNETKKGLDTQLKDYDTQLEELKKVDTAGLQTKIAELQAANIKAREDFDKQFKAAQLEFKLDARLMKEGAVNTRAVKSLLDQSKISLDGDNIIGVDEQLKTLRETEKWAFVAAGGVPGSGGNPPSDHTPDFNKMSDSEYYEYLKKQK